MPAAWHSGWDTIFQRYMEPQGEGSEPAGRPCHSKLPTGDTELAATVAKPDHGAGGPEQGGVGCAPPPGYVPHLLLPGGLQENS